MRSAGTKWGIPPDSSGGSGNSTPGPAPADSVTARVQGPAGEKQGVRTNVSLTLRTSSYCYGRGHHRFWKQGSNLQGADNCQNMQSRLARAPAQLSNCRYKRRLRINRSQCPLGLQKGVVGDLEAVDEVSPKLPQLTTTIIPCPLKWSHLMAYRPMTLMRRVSYFPRVV
jgi:hypothetical protein